MPILVKDYTWIQSDNMVNIRIPLTKNSYHENVDIFTTDSYVKVNFSPFLFEAFLLHEVDSKRSKCLVKEDEIILDLLKREPGEWECLEKDLTKAEKAKLRQEVIDKSVEESQKEKEDNRIKRQELDRYTVQRAMDIDSKLHEIMDSRREAEKSKAMEALEDWRLSNETNPTPVDQKSLPPFRSIPFKNEEANETSKPRPKSGVTITEIKDDEENKPVKKPPPPKSKPVNTPVRSEYIEKKKEELSKRVLPRLREAGTVEIKHTPRTFPTPSRESAHEEEQAWLKNITLARRTTGFVSEDLRPEEQDPQWCKDKGDEFFRNGNFLGAISAYSHGITLSDKLPSLYANRAATHFALGNFNKCMQDCSTALDLMKPACEGNRRSRAKCIARRAAALARSGYLNKAIQEMKVAQKMLPEDENIKKDIYDMERAWEQDPDDL
ncbi:dynein assembly factor 4, axonemal [Phthorimaea operculella]|nr:dynein assembly factor 4, axonemal [Phthorimaea operculella]